MQDIEIKLLLYRAVKRFYREESHFIMDGINEVGIVSRIAIHMDRIIRETDDLLCYNDITSEYNHLEIYTEFDRAYDRETRKPCSKQITNGNGQTLKVRPDLLLLEMEENFNIKRNILILEAKKIGSNKPYNADKIKLRSFVNQWYGDHVYQYQLGVHVIFGINGFILIWYKSFQTLTATVWKLSDSDNSYTEMPINEEYTIKDIKNYLK